VNVAPSLRLRHRPSRLGVLAVAVFCLRSLIPTGCMLATVDGHARLVLCPASVQRAGSMDTAGHALAMADGMAMDHGAMHHGEHAAAGAEHCPFAMSGGASLFASNQQPVEPFYLLLQPGRAPPIDSVANSPPLRFHAPRGPPSLS
jgi:hypothetical protein